MDGVKDTIVTGQLGVVRATEAVTLPIGTRFVNVDLTGTYTIKLPPVHAMVGSIVTLTAMTDASGTVTVEAVEGSGTYQSGGLTVAGDYLVLISNGHTWLELKEATT